MDKLDLDSPNLTAQNIEALAELFPGVVTEQVDPAGDPVLAIDFDLLRQELSDHVVEGPQERYQLDWPGKRAALFAANAPIAKTLRPMRDESVDFDTTANLFLEGDNLDALKLLQEGYLGKIKLIYIDPPYNTGNDFIYDDDFAESTAEYLERSSQVDEAGARLVANTESNGRFHSDWLSMMYPRLRLARRLLTQDGVLLMSIDDNEAHNLRKIGEEVFGAGNFVAQVSVQVNPRGRHLDRFVAKTHDSVLIFVRDASTDAIAGIAKEGRMADEYGRSDARGTFRLLGLRNRNQAFNPDTRRNLYFPLYVAPSDGRVASDPDAEFTDEVWPNAPDGTKTCWTWGKDRVKADGNLLLAERTNGEWRVYRKDYLHDQDGAVARTLVKSLWLEPEFNNDQGRRVIKQLFGSAVMDFPKSTDLLARMVEIACDRNGIVLDFFAGAATMAHAVMASNAKDAGSRRFVMVQLAEPCDPRSEAAKAGFETISKLAMERIRRAGAQLVEDNPEWHGDIGFRAFSVDHTGTRDILRTPDEVRQEELALYTDSIRDDRSGDDLLFQVLLSWGLDLALPISTESLGDREIHVVDDGALVACFAESITPEVVAAIAARQPLRAVFRDSAFESDADRINAEQVFAERSPGTDVKTI
jgi:adenine-specific DNA-methyltransferase